jgi:type IV secretory pathway VirB4 component
MSDKIDQDLIPYACYADKYTILTKNDFALQTIKVVSNLSDHDKFRQILRYIISQSYSQDIAFYSHTVKLTEYDTAGDTFRAMGRFEDDLMLKVEEMSNFSKSENVYFYLTFAKSILGKNIVDIASAFNPSLYYKKHSGKLREAIESLDEITKFVVEQLEEFEAKRLTIVEKENYYEAEHLNFFGKLINFTDVDYELPLESLCESVINSEYRFGKSIYKVKDQGPDKFVKIFTLKGYSEVSVDVIYKIIAEIPNIIISQANIPIDNKFLIKEYAKIAEIYKASTDEQFKNSQAFSSMNQLLEKNGEQDIYIKSQINLLVHAESMTEVSDLAARVAKIFAKTGIVAFTEDVHLQNAAFGMLPANFRFLARLSNVPIQLTAAFAYSEGSEGSEKSDFIWGKTLFSLPKENGKRYDIGLPKEQRNILLLGKKGSDTNLFGSLLSIAAIKNEVNTLFIDTNESLDSGLYLAGSSITNLDIDDKIDLSYIKINPFSGIEDTARDREYIKTVLILMSGGKDISTKIGFIMDEVIASKGSRFEFAIKEHGLSEIFQDWVNTGKYVKVFNYHLADDAFSIGKNLKINIKKSILNDKKIASVVNFIILFKIIELTLQKKRFLITFNSPLKIFKTKNDCDFLKQLLQKTVHNPDVSFVFNLQANGLEDAPNSPMIDIINEFCENKYLFSSGQESGERAVVSKFGFTDDDSDKVRSAFEVIGKSILIKNRYSSLFVDYNFAKLDYFDDILYDKSGKIMDLITEIGSETRDRIQIYAKIMEKMHEIEIQTSREEDNQIDISDE